MHILVGVIAGLASALLFAVVITGSPLALMLSYIAPLPIFIAAMGWRHHAGLIAAAVGTVAVSIALNVNVGAAFAIGHGLPAWWVAFLALLGRPVMTAQGETTEWYPLGRLLLWVAVVAALITLAGALAISMDHSRYQESMRGALEAVLRASREPGGPLGAANLPAGDVAKLAATLASLVPFVAGVSFFTMVVANLWLAAKATKAVGRLARPWPFMPATQLPREAAIAMAAATAGATFLGGFAGLALTALAGALTMAFFLSGLAAIHQMLADRPWRSALLAALYLALFVIFTIGLPVIALLGLADCLFNLRGPGAAPPAPPSPPQTPDTSEERKSPWK